MGIVSTFKEFVAAGYYGGAGRALMDGRYHDAIGKIEKAMSVEPNGEQNSMYLAFLGECHMRVGSYGPAVVALEQAVELMEAEMSETPSEWELQEFAKATSNLERSKKCLEQAESKNVQHNK